MEISELEYEVKLFKNKDDKLETPYGGEMIASLKECKLHIASWLRRYPNGKVEIKKS